MLEVKVVSVTWLLKEESLALFASFFKLLHESCLT